MMVPPPRRRKIVRCHGTFDLVHPGHIRHLVYAHSKGAKLIGGVTADIHVKKADHRPFVPEGLRALNLAALETVDYVTIDPQATPIQNILTIRPDYFVKGYEYQKGGLHPRTAEEKEADRKSTTSELQSLMRISYAVFCLKKKKNNTDTNTKEQ